MSLQLFWSPPPAEHQNGEILEYRVTIVEVETGREMQYNSTPTSMTASPLHPYYSYRCRVAAVTTAGIGPFTTAVEQRTDQDGVLQAYQFSYFISEYQNCSYITILQSAIDFFIPITSLGLRKLLNPFSFSSNWLPTKL